MVFIYRSWILWTSFLELEMSRYSRYRSRLILCEFGPPKILFGQIIATSHGPPKGSWGREIPLISGTSRLVKHYILARLYLCHESNGRYFVVRLVMSQQNFSSLCCLENVGNNWHGIWWKFQEIAPINQHQLGFGFISGLGWMKWMMDMKSREIYTIPPFLKDLVFIASTQAGRRYYTIIWSWQLYVPIPSMYDINLPTSGWFLWFSCI